MKFKDLKEQYMAEAAYEQPEGYTHFYAGEKDERYGFTLHIIGPTIAEPFIPFRPDEYRTIEGLLCLDAGSRPVVATILNPFDEYDMPERYVCKDRETAELYRACVVRNAMDNIITNKALTSTSIDNLWQLARNFMNAEFTEMEE